MKTPWGLLGSYLIRGGKLEALILGATLRDSSGSLGGQSPLIGGGNL